MCSLSIRKAYTSALVLLQTQSPASCYDKRLGMSRAEEGSGPSLTIRSKPDCYLKLDLLRTKKPPKQHV